MLQTMKSSMIAVREEVRVPLPWEVRLRNCSQLWWQEGARRVLPTGVLSSVVPEQPAL